MDGEAALKETNSPLAKKGMTLLRIIPVWHPHAESNHEQRFRKPPLYPFNYEGTTRASRKSGRPGIRYFFFLFFCAFFAF